MKPKKTTIHDGRMNPLESQIVKALKSGLTLRRVASRCDQPIRTVLYFAHKHGIQFPHEPKPSQCNKNAELVLEMVRNGKSQKEIGRKIGTTGNRVGEWLRRHGVQVKFPKTQPGDGNPNWRGGRRINQDGYVLIYKPDHPYHNHCGVYVYEHRLVAEKVLGRILDRKEVVHHKNSNHSDNRPENLEVFSCNSLHLANELSGRTPNWTPEGRRRMKEAATRRTKNPALRRLRLKKQDDLQWL